MARPSIRTLQTSIPQFKAEVEMFKRSHLVCIVVRSMSSVIYLDGQPMWPPPNFTRFAFDLQCSRNFWTQLFRRRGCGSTSKLALPNVQLLSSSINTDVLQLQGRVIEPFQISKHPESQGQRFTTVARTIDNTSWSTAFIFDYEIDDASWESSAQQQDLRQLLQCFE